MLYSYGYIQDFHKRENTFMKGHTIPLGRIIGIPIGLDYSWFLIFALFTWSLAVNYYPVEFKNWPEALYWLMGAVTAVMLFASVLLHELGHSVVALRYKIPVRSITLFIFGGIARIGAEPPSASAEFFIAVAGPVVSLLLAVLFSVLKPLFTGFETLTGLVTYLAYINFALVLFNLIPGFPLDGGRVFRAIIWKLTHNMRRATVIAANTGRFFGFFFIFSGVMLMFSGNFIGGLWLAFIGWFLDNAASVQVQQMQFRNLLAGHTVSQVMSERCLSIPHDMTLQQLVEDHILEHGRRCFLVARGEKIIGMMTVHLIKKVPRQNWSQTTTAQVMLPIEKLKSVAPDTEVWNALQLMDRDGVNQLPVLREKEIIGMLSRDGVITYLSTLHDLNSR